MIHRIRFTEEARDDLKRLYAFALQGSQGDWRHAGRIVDAIEAAMTLLATTPFAGRKAADDASLRELVIGFGSAGFVALYEIEGAGVVTVLAVRHQREDDYS
jgi:plasmid stabilization system protein ParE